MFDVEIVHTGWPGIALKLTTLEHGLADMHTSLQAAVELVYEHEREWFDTWGRAPGIDSYSVSPEGTTEPVHQQWKPLAASTIAQKTRRGYSQPARPLYATGELMRSATSPSGAHSTLFIGSNQAVIGINWQENGHQIPVLLDEGTEHMAARPIFTADDELVEKIISVIELHVFSPAFA